ncbi:MAG: hypothetical protein ACWGHH_06405 [Sulfurovaceae bacterium]
MTVVATGQISIADINDGSNAISALLSNEAFVFPASNTGVVSSYVGSGTTIKVFEGSTELVYDGAGATNGTWKLTTTPTNITVGTVTDSGTYAAVGNHSGVASGTDISTITYNITGVSILGNAFSISKTQSFSKSKIGATGATGATGSTGATGADAITYELLSSAYVANKDGLGVYTPSSLTFTNLKIVGNDSPISYAGRYKIYLNGSGTATYTSSADEASKVYTIPAGTTGIKVELYLAGGTTTKVDETTIAVSNDGQDKRLNLLENTWAVGTGNGTGKYFPYVTYGDGNLREQGLDQNGKPSVVWVTRDNDAASDADGGWTTQFNADLTKSYICAMYFRKHTDVIYPTFPNEETTSPVTVALSNRTHIFPASPTGAVTSYAGSGTDINVSDATAEIEFIGTGTLDDSFTLTCTDGVVYQTDISSITKTAGTTGWNAQAYSNEGYSTGCKATARAYSTSQQNMFGLNDAPASSLGYTDINYAFYMSNGTAYIYENGTNILNCGTYTTATVFEIKHTGTNIEYYLGGVLKRTVARGAGTLYFDCSLNVVNNRIAYVTFKALGAWRVTATPVNITPGAITDSGTYATMSYGSAVSASIDTSTIVYTISGITWDGTAFSVTKTQHFAKIKSNAGAIYFGPKYVNNMDNTANSNPYFGSKLLSDIPNDIWCVYIGFLHGNGTTLTTTGSGGLFRMDTGDKIAECTDFRLATDTTPDIRTYLLYDTALSEVVWANPQVYEINGVEPDINYLVGRMVPIGATAPEAYAGVDGVKPITSAVLAERLAAEALNYYESPWFSATRDTNYTLTHNLGTALIETVILGRIATGEIFYVTNTLHRPYETIMMPAGVSVEVTDTQLKLRTGYGLLYYRRQTDALTGNYDSIINTQLLDLKIMCKRLSATINPVGTLTNITSEPWNACDSCNMSNATSKALIVIQAAGGTTVSSTADGTDSHLGIAYTKYKLNTNATEPIIVTMHTSAVTFNTGDSLHFINPGGGNPYMLHNGVYIEPMIDKPNIYFTYRDYV